MRLAILDNGHRFGTRLLFRLIQVVSRQPAPEVVKVLLYRPEFFGRSMKKLTHEAMRGPSQWSVAERELMAAYVSKANACEFCTKAHAAVATLAYGNAALVEAVLCGQETDAIGAGLRVTLEMLQKLTHNRTLQPGDVGTVLDAGVSRRQIEDAFAVAFAFNTINRLADAFGFSVGGPEIFAAGAKFLLARGYR